MQLLLTFVDREYRTEFFLNILNGTRHKSVLTKQRYNSLDLLGRYIFKCVLAHGSNFKINLNLNEFSSHLLCLNPAIMKLFSESFNPKPHFIPLGMRPDPAIACFPGLGIYSGLLFSSFTVVKILRYLFF